MASSLSGAKATATGSGGGDRGGGSYHEKITTVAESAQKGGEGFETPNSGMIEEQVEKQEDDLIKALSDTDVKADGETDDVLTKASTLFSLEGFDESSMLLVTKKLMDNMLRKKPTVTISNVDLTEKVAEKLARSRFVARERNNVNLMASRWDQNKLVVYPIRSGETVDTLVSTEFPRTIKIKNVQDAAHRLLSSDNEQQEMVENFDLLDLPEEKVLEVLASGFIKTGVDYIDEIIKRSLIGSTQAGGNQLKEKLMKMKTHAEMVAYVRESGLVKDSDFRVTMQNMLVADLITILIDETKKTLETALVSYAIICNLINKKETTNCRLFRFTCVGSALLRARIGTSKSFKLSVDDSDYLSQMIVSLRCVESRGRTSILRLDVIGDVMLEQRAVVRLYSSLYRSTGVIDATTDEVITIQDDVFEGFMTADLIDFADTTEDYTVTNASSLVPMMVLGGIVPDNLEDPATNICWQISLRSVVNNLCRLNRVFDRSVDRNHFLFNFKTALIISSGLDSVEEIKRFIVQFFLWARFVDKSSNIVYTDYYVNSLISSKAVRTNSGLGAQCLWIASALFEMSEICETGYKYLPIIIFYNMLCSGEYSAKLVNMGVWLANSLNLNTNRLNEDKKLMETMEKLGVSVSVDWKRRLAMQPDIGSKITVSIEMIREQMKDVVTMVTGTSCTKTEAALLCKFALMSMDDSDSASDKSSADHISDISILVVEKMKKSAEQGEMSNEDYLMLVKELARDMEDDDEIKQVLNTEATKYHVICESLFEKKEKVARDAGKWKKAEVGEAPSSVRRKEMERQLIRDFTSQTVAFSEKARNTMYQLTDFNSSTMRDTLSMNGAIITSFLHRMGSLGGKDINILLSTLAGKGVGGTSALLSADDVNVLSVTSMETKESVRGENSSMSSTTKLTLLEGLSLTVGVSRTFDMVKLLEAIDRLTKKKSRSCLKLKENLKTKEMMKLELSESQESSSTNESMAVAVSKKQIVDAYFSSLLQEMKECFDVMEFESDEPAFGLLRRMMLASAGFPMSILNCIIVVVRRLSDLVWDSTTYLYDEIDETSKEGEKSMNEKGYSRARQAARMSIETLKVALSTALISYKVTFTTYFGIVEGSVSLIKRLSVKSSRRLYLLMERELAFIEFLFGFSTDLNRARKYVHGRKIILCEHADSDYSKDLSNTDQLTKASEMSKIETAICTVTKPIRLVNRFIVHVVNKINVYILLSTSKLTKFLTRCRLGVMRVYRYLTVKTRKSVDIMVSSFRAASGSIVSIMNERSSADEAKRIEKGKGVAEDDSESSSRPPVVSACGMQVIESSRTVNFEAEEIGAELEAEELRRVNDLEEASYEPMMVERRMMNETGSVEEQAVEASFGGEREENETNVRGQATLRLIIKRENRFTRFARVIATRVFFVSKILLEEWADTAEDIVYLIFSRTGYADKRNVIRLSTELYAGDVDDYERSVRTEAAKNRFYFRAFEAAYKLCQKVHNKFVDVSEYVAIRILKVQIYCVENLIEAVERFISRVEQLREQIAKFLARSNVASVVPLDDDSIEASSNTDGKLADQLSSSPNTDCKSGNGNRFKSRKMAIISHGSTSYDHANASGSSVNISDWLMQQDERCYESSKDDKDDDDDLKESREAYFAYQEANQLLYNNNESTVDEIDEESKSIVETEAYNYEAEDEKDKVVNSVSNSGRINMEASVFSGLFKEIKQRISAMVWMHEASRILKEELDSINNVDWVLTGLSDGGDKHLLRYVGKTGFNKSAIIEGVVDDAKLSRIEGMMNVMVSNGNCCWSNESYVKAMATAIGEGSGLSVIVVDESELSDKLADVIAREFEDRIELAVGESRVRCLQYDDKAWDAIRNVSAGKSKLVDETKRYEAEDVDGSGGDKEADAEPEATETRLTTNPSVTNHVMYDGSPMSRIFGRIASMTSLGSRKRGGSDDSSSAEAKYGRNADRCGSGLKLALMRSDNGEEGEDQLSPRSTTSNQGEDGASETEPRLKITQTGQEESGSITNEIIKLMTRTLTGNVVNYIKNWVGPREEPKDKIMIELIENLGQLSRDDEREIRLRGNASFAPIWDSIDDVLSTAVECDGLKEENNAVEIFGRRRIVKHGKRYETVQYLAKREIDIIDAGDVSILCLPANVNILKENLSNRAKYVKKGGDEYSCSMKAVCDVTAGKSISKVMKGKNCVVRNDSQGWEMLMIPNHLNAYGKTLPVSDLIDALDCLALSDADSSWLMTPRQLLKNMKKGDDDATVSGILARQEFDTSSKYFSIVSVDAVDWRGKSGAPIINAKGRFLGIILMQITDGRNFNILNEAGIIVCAKPSLVARPIFHSTNVKVAKCVCCRTKTGKRGNRNSGSTISESDSEISRCSDSRQHENRGSSYQKVCMKCVEIKDRSEDRLNAEDENIEESDQTRKMVCDECMTKSKHSTEAGKMERGKRMLLAGLSYLMGYDSNKNDSVDNGAGVIATKTGALERIGEILAGEKKTRADAGASDDIVIHNISEILYYSDQKGIDNLTKTVLKFILEQMVKGYKPVIVCGTNVCCLTIMLLLSSLRLRFDRIRSITDLQRACCHNYKNSATTTVVVSCEDIACSALSKEKMTLSCQHYKVRSLVLTSDNSAVKNCCLASLKILSLFLTNMTVVMYDCRRQNSATDVSDIMAAEKLKCMETKRVDTFQNCGVFHHLQLSNSVIETAEMNGFGEDADESEVRNVVITMCNNANDYATIRNRLGKAIDASSKSILVTNYGAFASKQIWEVMKTCKNVYLHTGTKASYVNDLIVNCNLDTDMSSNEKGVFLEAYKVASKLTMDDDKNDNTMMSVVTLKDMNSETSNDKNWFHVDYRTSSTSKTYNAGEFVKKINHTLIEDNTIVQPVSVIENKFRNLRTDNEEIRMTLTDDDLINENLVQKKRVKRPLLELFTVRIERCVSNFKWAWHNMTIGILMLGKRIKASVVRMLRRSKNLLKAKVFRCIAKMKRVGKELVSKTFRALQVNSTAGYFNQSSNAFDASGASKIMSSLYRCIGSANLAACVVGYKRKTFGDERKMDNSIIALMVSAGFETVSGNMSDGIRSALESVGNLIATVTGIGEVAYLILGWKKNFIIGNWKMSSCGLSSNKVVLSKMKQALNSVGHEMSSIEVVHTGLIIDDVRTNSIDCVTYLNMYELGLSLYEVVRKLWMSLRLSWLFSNLRKGIEHKNDHPFTTQKGLEVVPCYEIGPAVSSVVLIGTTGVIACSLALRRVETAVSSIAVITEKKHTYDMVEVYKQDRDLGAVLFRAANIGYGFFLLSAGSHASCAVGAASVCLGVADIATSSFSELGVCYSLSHIMVRIYTARNKIRAAINGWSAWYGRESTVASGLNALVITGLLSNPGKEDISEVKINDIRLKMALAQNKERLANGVLMDKSVKASVAFDNAKMIVLGRRSKNDVSDEIRWDHEYGASAEMLNLSLIATRGLGSDDWNRDNDKKVSLGELTTNQCRFIGRTKKLLKFDKQMVPDAMIEHQSSVLALHDELWKGVISESDREGWGAAGDSRYAVLLAIAERNDSPVVLDIDNELMGRVALRGVELISKIIPEMMRVRSKVKSLDWLTVVSNINERATSGILTRLRTGQQMTAGYIPNYGYRSELLCEMMHDDTMPDECSVINVFAKRRIEKKKSSRLTGVECVITRTIQANEVDLKVACSGSFVILDKLIKLTKCHNGLAIGLNFFIEFATDELNTSAECYKSSERENVRRVSLDHSSFDSSQRNWSITLCRELRILANEIVMLNNAAEIREANDLIKKIYDGLLIRLMLTTHGDLFAVTGQQMSGHATTSSDNSIKAYLYAMVTCDLMKKTFHCEMIENSLRAQGDDTKFDIIVKGNEVSDEEISASISKTMGKLGQVVKKEKIEVLRIGESSSFLSNKCGLSFFIMHRSTDKNRSWYESHLIPVRKRRDLIAMLATILKSSKNKSKRKTKKDISLLAAKSMSFLTMYVGDALVARVCVTVIWICFRALTEFRYAPSKMDITSTHLPWFVEQSGIEGEFEIKLLELMAMHGIVRKELSVYPKYWIVDRMDPDYSMIDLPQQLLRNARKAFPAIKDWEESTLLDAIKASNVEGDNRLVKVSIADVDERLNSIKEGLTLSIIEAIVPYEPFNRLKRKLKEDRIFFSNLGLRKVFVISEECKEEKEMCERILKQLEKPQAEECLNIDLTTKDGLIVKGMTIRIMTCKGYRIGVVDKEIKARLIEVNPWNIINMVCVKEESVAIVHSLGEGYCDHQKDGIMVTDLNMLNSHRNKQELNDDLNRALEGFSLERLSKLKLLISDDGKNTTRNILIARDKLWWKPR